MAYYRDVPLIDGGEIDTEHVHVAYATICLPRCALYINKWRIGLEYGWCCLRV
jgi:hypothetical protein